MIKRSIQQEDITIINIHEPNIGAPKYIKQILTKIKGEGFLGGAVVKNSPANAGDTGSSPGPGRSHMPRSK